MPPVILPVIDLKDRHVVRGVGGLRRRYRPIESKLCASSKPGDVAAAMVTAYSFEDAYVADLDAILDGRPQVEDWRKIAEAGLRLHLDAGLATLADCQRVIEVLARENVASVIVGLETLRRWEDLEQIAAEFGDDVTFSLDLRHGRPLRIVGAAIRPEEVAQRAFECGVRRIVLLDLAHIGQGRGTGTEMLCRELSTQLAGVEWITGGGMQTSADIAAQLAIGASRVLVSSALHEDEKILMPRPQ
ncbi:phosphoribosylformimino-5-aminoimidazole carboxamide ribotide isomerase related protein [Blastopirellula marina DSM 3645]|uniref:Phosphoribosylformimino-5-aminoimidazole carboxamide ribotide isomerase related protein n=1 Tax=Blastopirellula marina DSM 3645 TaxID=314230 RepID=A3ZZD2_9BACT|nr:phosphoribosylformimino-5-aminoimidazole carboxamide ribotide isomerase related protein [Blastopirellula marina DSM 3645]